MTHARCPGCRTRRATFTSLLRHVAKTGHKACDCGQGYAFPHRPGSRGCVHAPWDELTNEPRAALHTGDNPPF